MEGMTPWGLAALLFGLWVLGVFMGYNMARDLGERSRYRSACENIISLYLNEGPNTGNNAETFYLIARDARFPDLAKLSIKKAPREW